MHAGLRDARHRLWWSVVRDESIVGLRALAWVCLAGATAWSALGVAVMSGLAPDLRAWRAVVVGGLAIAIIGVCARAGRRVWRRRPDDRAVAERLDLGRNAYNEVATALDLLNRDVQDSFGRAAIAVGLEALRREGDTDPHEPSPPRVGRSAIAAVAVAVALGAFIYWMQVSAGVGMEADGQDPVTSRPLTSVAWDNPGQSGSDRASAPAVDRGPLTAGGEARREAGAPPGHRSDGETRQTARGGVLAEVRTGGSSGTAAGGAVSPASPSSPTEADREDNAASRRARPKDERTTESGDSSGVIRGRGASTSRGTAVDSEGHTSGLGTGIDASEDDRDDASDDPPDAEEQGGGVRLSLRDRRPSPSRGLGISGPKGPPGSGRGGPSPAKKSRGTASLLLGVPMPDHVPGKPQAGPMRTTRESVDPSPQELETTAAPGAIPRHDDEAPVPTPSIAWPDAGFVSRFLERARTDPETVPSQSGTDDGVSPRDREE